MTNIDVDKQIEFAEMVDDNAEEETVPTGRRMKNTAPTRTGRRIVES